MGLPRRVVGSTPWGLGLPDRAAPRRPWRLVLKLQMFAPMFGFMISTGNGPTRAPLQRAIALLGGIPLLIGGWHLVSVPLAFFVLFLLGSAMALTALFGGSAPILPPGRIARGLDVLTFGWVEMAAKLDSLTRPRW